MDSGLLKLSVQGLFAFSVTTLFLSWLGSKLSKMFSRRNQEFENSITDNPDVIARYKSEHYQEVERIQKYYNKKSQEYKEKILVPREDEKKKKKEQEYRRFLGAAWKGEGSTLGGHTGNEKVDDDVSMPEGRRAAYRRKVPENINHSVAATAAAAAANKKTKSKRVIELPDEPDEAETQVVTVKLRTPLGTVCSRRFHQYTTVQCLLDYMTTQGFNQKVYTISTLYPRRLLEDPAVHLSEFGFGNRVVLNIEEKD